MKILPYWQIELQNWKFWSNFQIELVTAYRIFEKSVDWFRQDQNSTTRNHKRNYLTVSCKELNILFKFLGWAFVYNNHKLWLYGKFIICQLLPSLTCQNQTSVLINFKKMIQEPWNYSFFQKQILTSYTCSQSKIVWLAAPGQHSQAPERALCPSSHWSDAGSADFITHTPSEGKSTKLLSVIMFDCLFSPIIYLPRKQPEVSTHARRPVFAYILYRGQ